MPFQTVKCDHCTTRQMLMVIDDKFKCSACTKVSSVKDGTKEAKEHEANKAKEEADKVAMLKEEAEKKAKELKARKEMNAKAEAEKKAKAKEKKKNRKK